MRISVRSAAPIAIAAVIVALLPLVLPQFMVFDMIFVAAYAIAILGLVVLTGMNGQISLGHGAFLAIGGYTVAIVGHGLGLPYVASVPIAAVVTGIFGLGFGFVALRLEGAYLALATFSLAVAMPSLLKHFKSVTGGFNGVQLDPIAAPSWFSLGSQAWLYYVTWAVLAIVFAVTALLVRGRFGRALRALRDNPIAAVSFGIKPAQYKTLAFGWSAVLAGISGAMFSIPTAYLSPDSFAFSLSITLLIGAVIGGIMSFWGAILGAIVVQFLPIVAQQINAGAPYVVYGVVLVLVMLFMPDGLVGAVWRLVAWMRRSSSPSSLASASTPSSVPIVTHQPTRE